METSNRPDCIVIGYNETPFGEYEKLIGGYGEESEAYRDLKFSFVALGGKKMNYVDLLNHVHSLANQCDERAISKDEFKSCDIPNLAAIYLTHYLRKKGLEASYINLFQFEKDKFAQFLAEDPLCVAITTTFYLMNFPVNEIVQFVRERNRKVKIIVGGPLIANHARNYQEKELLAALNDIGADIYVIESQGEFTLWQVIQRLKTGGDFADVPNIIYANGGAFQRTPVKSEANSLDENYIDWGSFSHQEVGPTLQVRTARSCAFSCSFCNYPNRAGKLTLASLETVEKELESMHKIGVNNVVFIDDTFNVPLPRFKDICRLMIKKNYKFNWFSYFRCSNSDDEAIDLMAQSGCRGVFLGIESGSPTILKNMNKAATVEKYIYGIKRLRQYNIMSFASFVVGFPGETEDTVKETVDFIKETSPDYYRAQLWYCESGTPIERQRDKYKIVGDGFVWSHATMDSMEAMDHLEKVFLVIDESIWLPQWSFDFWVIPYLFGKGLSLDRFRSFMTWAHKLLALGIASVPAHEKNVLEQEYLHGMLETMKDWRRTSQGTDYDNFQMNGNM